MCVLLSQFYIINSLYPILDTRIGPNNDHSQAKIDYKLDTYSYRHAWPTYGITLLSA